ncbi:DUF6817 domain-containing protein [Streptomyces sp. 7R007]
MPRTTTPTHQATAFLRELGADRIPHPGGTLLAHLDRVRDRLTAWNARPALRLAGLCHAAYGTDGFPAALLSLDRRTELAAVIGPEAEELVYFYASCDRRATYPDFATPGSRFRDRFTGRTLTPPAHLRRDFAELTAANELDLAHRNRDFRAQWGPELLALFTRFRPLLSEAAWQDCLTVLESRPAHGS